MSTSNNNSPTPKPPHSHRPVSTDSEFGRGCYSDKTQGCYSVIQRAQPLVLAAVTKALDVRKNSKKGAAAATAAAVAPFTVLDLGTADAGTSMPLMKAICKHIETQLTTAACSASGDGAGQKSKNSDKMQVQIFYEDQPTNDFATVFARLEGLLPDAPTTSVTQDFPESVFAAAIGRSFFSQCVPRNTVDLSVSFTAMHWLSKKPGQLTDGIHHVLCTDEHEVAMYTKQAARDWEQILSHRARELKVGCRAVIVLFCVDEEGRYLGHTAGSQASSMWANMNLIWKHMSVEGLITPKEYADTSFASYYRSVDEIVAPFATHRSRHVASGSGDGGGDSIIASSSSPVGSPTTTTTKNTAATTTMGTGAAKQKAGKRTDPKDPSELTYDFDMLSRFQGLSLLSLKTAVVKCPYRAAWLKTLSELSAEADAADMDSDEGTEMLHRAKVEHAKKFVPTTRTWSNSTFLDALSSSDRTLDERKRLVQVLFDRYEALVADQGLLKHSMDYVQAYVELEKIPVHTARRPGPAPEHSSQGVLPHYEVSDVVGHRIRHVRGDLPLLPLYR